MKRAIVYLNLAGHMAKMDAIHILGKTFKPDDIEFCFMGTMG